MAKSAPAAPAAPPPPAPPPAASAPAAPPGPPPPMPHVEHGPPPGPSDADIIAEWGPKLAAAKDAAVVASAPPPAAPAAPSPTADIPAPPPSADVPPPAATPSVVPDGQNVTPPADPLAALDARMAAYVERQATGVLEAVRLKQERDALQAERDRLKAESDAFQERLLLDPLAAVKERTGEDFEALANRAVKANSPELRAVAALQAEVAKLRQESEAARQAAQAAEVQRQVDAFRASVMPALEAKRAEYPTLLALMDGGEVATAVHGLVQSTYHQSNGARLLSIPEAAALLEASAKQRLERIRPLVTAAAPPPTPPKPTPTKPAAPKGLTNTVTQAAPSAPAGDDDLSDEALTAKARAYYAELMRSKAS